MTTRTFPQQTLYAWPLLDVCRLILEETDPLTKLLCIGHRCYRTRPDRPHLRHHIHPHRTQSTSKSEIHPYALPQAPMV